MIKTLAVDTITLNKFSKLLEDVMKIDSRCGGSKQRKAIIISYIKWIEREWKKPPATLIHESNVDSIFISSLKSECYVKDRLKLFVKVIMYNTVIFDKEEVKNIVSNLNNFIDRMIYTQDVVD